MSGHSKWATTKHKKAVIDAKRGKLFAKLIKNIEVAARMGGVDLEGNPTLYDAVQKAKKQSVPNKNIDSAIKRGGGLEAGGADYETIMYEGYGPNGVAVLIECLTDNRNRAASDVRVAMTRNGGSMADPGSVSYMFSRKGVVIVPKGELGEDDVLGAVLDAGAEEVNDLGETFEVISEATDLVAVRTALQEAGIDYDSADSSFVPSVQVELDEEGARKIFKLIDALEDSDDVQNVFANFDVSDEVMEKVAAYREPADLRSGPEAVLRRADELLAKARAEGAYERLTAVGIGVPGPVSFRDGVPVSPPIMPGWDRFPVREYLAREYGCPAVVDNDANIMAVGEWQSGAARSVDDFLFVKIGTGVGCGIYQNGDVYRGTDGCAGDIGHIQVDAQGPVCSCGNAGCVEALFSGAADRKSVV